MNRLFDLKRAGTLRSFVLPYLGQDDNRLKFRPADLVTREEAYAYPTDFSAMKAEWIDRLSRRGEQLTRALVAEHAPDLVAYGDSDSAGLQQGSASIPSCGSSRRMGHAERELSVALETHFEAVLMQRTDPENSVPPG